MIKSLIVTDRLRQAVDLIICKMDDFVTADISSEKWIEYVECLLLAFSLVGTKNHPHRLRVTIKESNLLRDGFTRELERRDSTDLYFVKVSSSYWPKEENRHLNLDYFTEEELVKLSHAEFSSTTGSQDFFGREYKTWHNRRFKRHFYTLSSILGDT